VATSRTRPTRTSGSVRACADVLLTSAPATMSVSPQTDRPTRAYHDRLRLTGADRPSGWKRQVEQVRVLGAARADAGRVRRVPITVASEQHRVGDLLGHRLGPGVRRRWIVRAPDEKDRRRAADCESLVDGPRPHRPEGALEARVLDDRAEDLRRLGEVGPQRVVGRDVCWGVEVHALRSLVA